MYQVNRKTMKIILLCMFIMIDMMIASRSRPYIKLNTRDSWFSYQKKIIAWNIYETDMCVLPLNTTLSLVDCGNNGQVVKSISTQATSIIVDCTDFRNLTNFYAINATDSANNFCGRLFSLVHIHSQVQTEVQIISEGGDYCINILSIGFESHLYAFWPKTVEATENCFCLIENAVLRISLSDCYCLKQELNPYTVTYNKTSFDLCWKNIDLTMNGTVVGIAKEESADCGDHPHITARTYLKISYMLVEENISTAVIPKFSRTTTSTFLIPGKHLLPTPSASRVLNNEIVIKMDQPKDNLKQITALLSAGIPSLVTAFAIAIIIGLIVTMLAWKARQKKNAKKNNIDPRPVYEPQRLSTEVSEPVYEDIKPLPNTTPIENDIIMGRNEAYTIIAVKKKTQHAPAHNIGMEDNAAYSVRKMIGKQVAVYNITMKENEAYQVPF